MKYLLTICSNDKNPAEGLLPARERYQSEFMQRVIQRGEDTDIPVLILSGEHGLLRLNSKIAYYDHALTKDEVPYMAKLVADQLGDLGVTEIEAYIKKDRDVPGWEPYYNLLELGTRLANVDLHYAERESLEPRFATARLR